MTARSCPSGQSAKLALPAQLMAAPGQTTQGLPDATTALLQALAQALAPFVKLNYSPGTAATDNVAAAAQSQLAELDLPTTIQLLWSLASLQALPSKVWNAVMGRIVDLLTPFADMAGKWLATCRQLSSNQLPCLRCAAVHVSTSSTHLAW